MGSNDQDSYGKTYIAARKSTIEDMNLKGVQARRIPQEINDSIEVPFGQDGPKN